MTAYTKWMRLVEDPRFVIPLEWPEHSIILVNNHRVLHGRASRPADGTERVMVLGLGSGLGLANPNPNRNRNRNRNRIPNPNPNPNPIPNPNP